MPHVDLPSIIGLLALMLFAAKVAGWVCKRAGQPAVLGELVAGVVLGASALGVVSQSDGVLHVLAEIGVIVLLFEIGLETDLLLLLRTGGVSATVACAGVVLPFVFGYAVCWLLGLGSLVAIMAGAALTATSVGITARVLSDLGRMQDPESQIILGAAVIDDVIGLIILAVVSGLTQGKQVTAFGIAKTAGLAFGFLIATLVVGRFVVPVLVRLTSRVDLPGTATILAVVLAFGLAWLAAVSGSAMVIGAFAAGLLLRESPQAQKMEKGVAHLGHFFVPLFFVVVGSAVDLRVFNPFDVANHRTLLVGGLLILAAVSGKFFAGYAPFWFTGNKQVIGIGMIPRGEVGIIFAQMGLAAGVFDAGMFSAVMLMVMLTTFLAPPLLTRLLPSRPDFPKVEPEGIEDLV
jgi:Na+:H+ antiporter